MIVIAAKDEGGVFPAASIAPDRYLFVGTDAVVQGQALNLTDQGRDSADPADSKICPEWAEWDEQRERAPWSAKCPRGAACHMRHTRANGLISDYDTGVPPGKSCTVVNPGVLWKMLKKSYVMPYWSAADEEGTRTIARRARRECHPRGSSGMRILRRATRWRLWPGRVLRTTTYLASASPIRVENGQLRLLWEGHDLLGEISVS